MTDSPRSLLGKPLQVNAGFFYNLSNAKSLIEWSTSLAKTDVNPNVVSQAIQALEEAVPESGRYNSEKIDYRQAGKDLANHPSNFFECSNLIGDGNFTDKIPFVQGESRPQIQKPVVDWFMKAIAWTAGRLSSDENTKAIEASSESDNSRGILDTVGERLSKLVQGYQSVQIS